jgi:hypothetical protein
MKKSVWNTDDLEFPPEGEEAPAHSEVMGVSHRCPCQSAPAGVHFAFHEVIEAFQECANQGIPLQEVIYGAFLAASDYSLCIATSKEKAMDGRELFLKGLGLAFDRIVKERDKLGDWYKEEDELCV